MSLRDAKKARFDVNVRWFFSSKPDFSSASGAFGALISPAHLLPQGRPEVLHPHASDLLPRSGNREQGVGGFRTEAGASAKREKNEGVTYGEGSKLETSLKMTI